MYCLVVAMSRLAKTTCWTRMSENAVTHTEHDDEHANAFVVGRRQKKLKSLDKNNERTHIQETDGPNRDVKQVQLEHNVLRA